MDTEEFNEEEQIVYLTYREQFAIIMLIERTGLAKSSPWLKSAYEKMKPDVDKAFKTLGRDEN